MSLVIPAVLAVLLGGCASVPRATHGGQLSMIWGSISTKDFLRVRGIGVAKPGAAGSTARRGASRNAALVAARYQLLSVVKGVKLEGGVTVSQLMEKDSLIREIANEVVSGGDEVKTEWLADDGCVVTLELKRSKVEHLINEKTQREVGLEARVAKDIEEIRALNAKVEELKRGLYDTNDPDVIKWRYGLMSVLTAKAEERLHWKGGPQVVTEEERQDALVSAWALDFILNKSPEDQKRFAKESAAYNKKADAEIWRKTKEMGRENR